MSHAYVELTAMSQQCMSVPYFIGSSGRVRVRNHNIRQFQTRVELCFEIGRYKVDFSYNFYDSDMKNVTDFDACHFIFVFILIFFFFSATVLLSFWN